MEAENKSSDGDPSLRQGKRRIMLWRILTFLVPILLLATFFCSVSFIIVPLVKKKFLNQQFQQVVNLNMLAENIVNGQHQAELDGTKTRQVAQRDALERIESLRYGEDRSGYFWVLDENGIIIAHPVIPSLKGKLPGEVDSLYRGSYQNVRAIALALIQDRKSAFVSYEWLKAPGAAEKYLKTSYMHYYEPWKWLIGTGLDMKSIEDEIDRFLFLIIVIGLALGIAAFAVSFMSALRLSSAKRDARKAESMLSESESRGRATEKRFETIFNNSLFGIGIVRMEDNAFVQVNGAFERMTGYSSGELLGSDAVRLGLFSAEDCRRLAREFLSGDLDGSAGKNVFFALRTKGGEEKAVSLSVVPQAIEGVMHSIMFMADITESKALQEQLAQSQRMDTIGQLAGGVAHDFNNMLTGIIGSAEILSIKLDAFPEERGLVEVIMNAALRASELTSKLLAFSRRGKIVSTPIDVHESVRAVIALLERSIDKRISIVTDLGARESVIVGDPSLIQNAFLNIAINARDAMPEGGTMRIATRNLEAQEMDEPVAGMQAPKGPCIEIAISDTGNGIPKEALPRIFEPFFTTKPQGRGTGLGLSAVYGTVKDHQGCLSVRSEPGAGTEFRICLPLSGDGSPAPAADPGGPVGGQGKILVIDDESIIRSSAFGMLSSLGYDVALASDGESGIKAYREAAGSIDLVLLDMVMPGMSGKETLLRLKREFPDAKVIFSSGFNPDALKGEVLKLGALDFIQKPYRLADLSAIIARRMRQDS